MEIGKLRLKTSLRTKTSRKQFETIIDFMEKNGDMSGHVVGRLQNYRLWNKLVNCLNADPSGRKKNFIQWRKVWHDMKKRTRSKYQKFEKALMTDPNRRAKLNALEKRILPFVCRPNASYSQADSSKTQTQDSEMQQEEVWMFEIHNEDDDNAGGEPSSPENSSHPEESVHPEDNAHHEDDAHPEDNTPKTPISLSSSPMLDGIPSPSPHTQESNDKSYSIVNALIELSKQTRENESKRDRMMFELEKERLRHRGVELKLQTQWLSLMNGALETVKSYLRVPKK